MAFSRRRSLAVKIPLLTSVLLLAALGAMSVASYIELRSALIEQAAGRLEQAAGQMANVFAMSARQRIAGATFYFTLPSVARAPAFAKAAEDKPEGSPVPS